VRRVAAIFVLTSVLLSQQVPEPTPVPGVIRINVNLVQVDAVVTDSKGKPVTNLKAEDFEVRQDGELQKIRNFEFVRVANPLRGLEVPSRAVSAVGLPGAPPPPPPPSADKVRRTVALLVDDLAMSFDGTVHVRDALRKWVNDEMQPGDLVSVVRTNAAMGALQQFSNDKRLLLSAIDRVKYQPGRVSVGGFKPFDPGFGITIDEETGEEVEVVGPNTSLFDDEVKNAYLTGSYNAIRYVIRGLRDLPGRKSLVIFSEDLSLPSRNSLADQRKAVEDRLRLLAEEAIRSSVVIHVVDARGSVYTGATAEDNLNDRTAQSRLEVQRQRIDDYVASQDGMSLLSQRTGGLFISGNNNLADALRKSVSDGDGYYLLGYQPEGATFDLKDDLVRYHSIKVRLKRPGLTIRSRSGFYGLSDVGSPTTEKPTPVAQLAHAIVSPFTTGDIRVRMTTSFSYSEKDGSYVNTWLHVDAHDLAFKEESDGTRTAVADIAVFTFDPDGEPSQTDNRTWTIRIKKDGYEDVLRNGLLYAIPVKFKRSGPYQLRVAIRDATSEKLGSAMQFLEIPNVRGGQLALSGIAVASDVKAAGNSDGTPVVRIFKSGDVLAYAYEVFNARTNSDKKTEIETQARVYRDGEIVYQGSTGMVSLVEKNRLLVGGRLELKSIPAGDYALQIVVFDKVRKNRSGIVAQSIDFEVR
jgi:VWFA-related protein